MAPTIEAPYTILEGNELQDYRIRRSIQSAPRLAAAAAFWADVIGGRVPHYLLKEAFAPRTPAVVRAINSNYPGILQLSETHTRSDFPQLTGDVLGRMALARYREFPSSWRQFAKVTTNLVDFRPVKRVPLDGLEGPWPEQMEDEELEYGSLAEGGAVTVTPRKYSLGARLSFELILNDDLDAFQSIPNRLGRGGSRTIGNAVTRLYVGPTGPLGTVYSVGNANIVPGNPVLSINALSIAYGMLRGMVDSQGQPIAIDMAVLVVPPALEVVARNILQASVVRMTSTGGVSGQEIEVNNWIGSSLSLAVDPNIPVVATTNGNTSWFLFASPSTGSAAIEVAFVSGYSEPVIYQKVGNSARLDGGLDQEAGDFGTMSQDWKGLVAFGAAVIDPRLTVGSNGTGT